MTAILRAWARKLVGATVCRVRGHRERRLRKGEAVDLEYAAGVPLAALPGRVRMCARCEQFVRLAAERKRSTKGPK